LLGWAVLWQKAQACPTAPTREQRRPRGGQSSSSPGHQAPPCRQDTSPRVAVGSVELVAGPGRTVEEQETDTASSCVRGGLDWILQKTYILKEWSGIAIGCPGKWWSHHPWRC